MRPQGEGGGGWRGGRVVVAVVSQKICEREGRGREGQGRGGEGEGRWSGGGRTGERKKVGGGRERGN